MSNEHEIWEQLIATAGERKMPSVVTGSVKREFPEFEDAVRSHAATFTMSRPSYLSGASSFRRWKPVRIFAGWEKAMSDFEVWSVVGVIGPGGLRRITSRLDVLGSVLREELAHLDENAAHVLAELVRAAAWPLEPSPTLHQSVVTPWTREKIDANEQGYPNIDDVEGWRRIRERLAPPSFDGTTLRFCHVDSFARGSFRFTAWTATIDRATGVVWGNVEDLATLAGRQHAFPTIGRPFVVEGARRVATLVAREDWADVDE